MDKDELEAKLSLDGDEDSDWMSDDEDEISSGVLIGQFHSPSLVNHS